MYRVDIYLLNLGLNVQGGYISPIFRIKCTGWIYLLYLGLNVKGGYVSPIFRMD